MNLSYRIRLIFLALVIFGGCLVLFYRLWVLQIKNQEDYIKKQPVTRTAKQRVPGTRGHIFDRNRVEFAGNETNMEVGLNLSVVENAWKEKHHKDLRRKQLKIPTFTYGARADEATDIIALLNEMVFPELNRLKLYRDFSNEKQKEKQKQAIINHYLTNKGIIPFPYEKDLLQNDEESFKRYVAYAENAPSIPGITLTERPKRRYPLKAMAGHLIGYIRETVIRNSSRRRKRRPWIRRTRKPWPRDNLRSSASWRRMTSASPAWKSPWTTSSGQSRGSVCGPSMNTAA